MIKEIINGYKNYLSVPDEGAIDKALERASICDTCPRKKKGLHSAFLPDHTVNKIQGFYCGECGCPLSPKVRAKESKCPLGKW